MCIYIYSIYKNYIYIYTYIIYNRFTGYKSTRSLYFPVYVHYMGNSSMAIKSWEDIPFNPLTNPDWFGCNFPLSWENDGNIAFKTIKPISTRRIWVPSHPLSGLCSSKVPSAACQDTVAMCWKRHGKTAWVWDVIPYPVDILFILNTLIWSQ